MTLKLLVNSLVYKNLLFDCLLSSLQAYSTVPNKGVTKTKDKQITCVVWSRCKRGLNTDKLRPVRATWRGRVKVKMRRT